MKLSMACGEGVPPIKELTVSERLLITNCSLDISDGPDLTYICKLPEIRRRAAATGKRGTQDRRRVGDGDL